MRVWVLLAYKAHHALPVNPAKSYILHRARAPACRFLRPPAVIHGATWRLASLSELQRRWRRAPGAVAHRSLDLDGLGGPLAVDETRSSLTFDVSTATRSAPDGGRADMRRRLNTYTAYSVGTAPVRTVILIAVVTGQDLHGLPVGRRGIRGRDRLPARRQPRHPVRPRSRIRGCTCNGTGSHAKAGSGRFGWVSGAVA